MTINEIKIKAFDHDLLASSSGLPGWMVFERKGKIISPAMTWENASVWLDGYVVANQGE